MDPILDETSLAPCASRGPGARIAALAATLKALDGVGLPRVLRSVRRAPDIDIGDGSGLRSWCFRFRQGVDRDAGVFLAGRLGKQPFVDGPGGLFGAAEGSRVVVPRARGADALGLGLVALEGGVGVALGSAAIPAGGRVAVELTSLDDDGGERCDVLDALCVVRETEVASHRATLVDALDGGITDGPTLLARAPEMFPLLRFGARARVQIAELSGNEVVFRQLLRHLRALHGGAVAWTNGPFEPASKIAWSQESRLTLDDGKLGPLRDFPVPDGFAEFRWSLHTKLTGGAEARLYFSPERVPDGPVVLIGYFGKKIPTALFRG
jgi:hypothetical protein